MVGAKGKIRLRIHSDGSLSTIISSAPLVVITFCIICYHLKLKIR